MRVLVTFAVEAEFAPWRRRHAFRRKESVRGSRRAGSDVWYSSRIDDLTLDVCLTGVGWKGPTAVLSALLKEKPDLCISSGLAGGLRPELKSGEIVVAREALSLDGGKKSRSRLFSSNWRKKRAQPPSIFSSRTPKLSAGHRRSNPWPGLATWWRWKASMSCRGPGNSTCRPLPFERSATP